MEIFWLIVNPLYIEKRKIIDLYFLRERIYFQGWATVKLNIGIEYRDLFGRFEGSMLSKGYWMLAFPYRIWMFCVFNVPMSVLDTIHYAEPQNTEPEAEAQKIFKIVKACLMPFYITLVICRALILPLFLFSLGLAPHFLTLLFLIFWAVREVP